MFLDRSEETSFTQGNEIIESCYAMNLIEKRLLILVLSKINPMVYTGKYTFYATIKEWNDIYPDTCGYRDFRKAAKLLRPRYVTIHKKNNDANVELDINWFETIEYTENSQIAFTFTKSIMTRLAGMIGNFTPIKLLEVSKLKSIYSIRLYELLRQKIDFNNRSISVEDIRFYLNCQEKYKTTKLLKQKVLKPSIDEINKKTSLNVECKLIKKGRSITHYHFVY